VVHDDDMQSGFGRTRDAEGHSSPAGAAFRRRILAAVEELTARHGRPPTHRELSMHLGLASHSRLSEGLDDLVRVGRLHRLPGTRNLIVVRPPVIAMK
jgi:hypothetical protein